MSFELQGKYGKATVFTENIDDMTIGQVISFLNEEFTEGVRVSIMPDTHAGKGAVIGTTMEIKDKLVPNLVGSDIGCGVLCVEVDVKGDISFDKLDEVIFGQIPLGPNVHNQGMKEMASIPLKDMYAFRSRSDVSEFWQSMGTLGGGNHFIELSKSEDGRHFLTIHTGSRSVGSAVCRYHQKAAVKQTYHNKRAVIVNEIKEKTPKHLLSEEISKIKGQQISFNEDLAYLEGEELERYLHDLRISQKFATENRNMIARKIIAGMGWTALDSFDSIHNYVDIENMILRKGAISAKAGERVIVPINMRDGSIIAVGKGNPEWNSSAPHGAGRLLSRSSAKQLLDVEEFKEQMSHIHSKTVGLETLDEAPAAYKPMDEIIENTKATMDIQLLIKPIYNIKGN